MQRSIVLRKGFLQQPFQLFNAVIKGAFVGQRDSDTRESGGGGILLLFFFPFSEKNAQLEETSATNDTIET